MVVLQVSLIILALISYIQTQRKIARFDKDLIADSAWDNFLRESPKLARLITSWVTFPVDWFMFEVL